MLKAYYRLTKPGIIYGNAITAIAGFLLASGGIIQPTVFVAMLAGISLVIASACVCNNFIDRDIDRKMSRTRQRALVSGAISSRSALIFAAALFTLGGTALYFYTNLAATLTALTGFFVYVVVYGIAKRRSVYGTEIGSIAGAVPITVGYVAVSGIFDVGALLVFLALVFWQMPHFYAIAMYRTKDYAAASIPVLPLQKGIRVTKLRMFVYIVLFTVATIGLTVAGYTGYMYAVLMGLAGAVWLYVGLKGFDSSDDAVWGKKMFKFSLNILLVYSFLISIDTWLV